MLITSWLYSAAMWSKWLSSGDQDPGIITVSHGTPPRPRTPLEKERAALQQLMALKQHAPPLLTAQQQAAAELEANAAVQQEAVGLTQKLTDITGVYQSWSEHRCQGLLKSQQELHTRVDDLAAHTKTTVMHVKRATASIAAAEQVLLPVPQLADSLSSLVEQVSKLQSQLLAAQARCAARAAPAPSAAPPLCVPAQEQQQPPDASAKQQCHADTDTPGT